MNDQGIKLLIVDNDWQASQQLLKYSESRGFETKLVSSIREALEVFTEWSPKLILSDMILGDGNGLEIHRFLKENPALCQHQPQFIIMSAHNQVDNIKIAIDHGVQDYIVKPFQKESLVQRLLFHCRSLKTLEETDAADLAFVPAETKSLHLIQLLLKQALKPDEDIHKSLMKICQMLSLKTKCVRANVVRVHNESLGEVMISHDDPSVSGFQLDLTKYPEIQQLHFNPRTIAIENIEGDANLNFIKEHLKNIDFNSMILCPIFRNFEFFGVLSLKFPPTKHTFNEGELRFVEIAAQVISLAISHCNHQNIPDSPEVAA